MKKYKYLLLLVVPFLILVSYCNNNALAAVHSDEQNGIVRRKEIIDESIDRNDRDLNYYNLKLLNKGSYNFQDNNLYLYDDCMVGVQFLDPIKTGDNLEINLKNAYGNVGVYLVNQFVTANDIFVIDTTIRKIKDWQLDGPTHVDAESKADASYPEISGYYKNRYYLAIGTSDNHRAARINGFTAVHYQ